MTTAREAFLAERRTGIGGSDIAALAGVSPWATPLDVWRSKVLGDSNDETERMRWGTLMEPLLRAEASRVLGVASTGPEFLRDGWRIANIDGRIGGDVLECKTAASGEDWGIEGTDDVPDQYLAQVQWYLGLTDLQRAQVAVLIGGNDFRIYTVVRSDVIIDRLREVAERFWFENVKTETPPPPSNLADAKKLWRSVHAGKVIPATPAIIEALDRHEARRLQIKAMEEEQDRDELMLRCMMEEAEAVCDDAGSRIATLKGQTRRRYAVPPEIEAQYEVEPSRFRVLRLTKWWAKRVIAEANKEQA